MSQIIHMKVESLANQKWVYLTFIYAFNVIQDRVPLWQKLKCFAARIRGPWAVGGDFNCVLDHIERCGGSSSKAEIEHFKNCMVECGMLDIRAIGSLFTWNNKRRPEDRTYSRLDRFMVNQDWCDLFPDMFAHFLPEGNYDHTPCIVSSNKHT
ncbi:uncharacterized protein LOC141617298 [Silene latifolia]|uniref:uncharacterized protein LOC141617298 n=1 Tax=Silene latifolia TaxID=37657 RepID=UPI003D7777EF